MLPPLQFVPFLRSMVWGGRRLGTVLGKPLPDDQPYGESWEISDHPLHRSVVANGPLAGRTLRELTETRRDELLGSQSSQATFPILVKYLDANDWLSVQVHPDEAAVKRLWPGEGSKTEAWFVLDASPESRIYAGLLPDVDDRKLRAALHAGTVAECLHSFVPRPGDCVFLPAGTVHAVGGGVLMAEVQQTSDATFRLFDWNRRDAQGNQRKLHVEEAMGSIHWGKGPVTPVRVPGFAESTTDLSQSLVECRYFALEFVRRSRAFPYESSGRPMLILILAGEGVLRTEAGEDTITRGQTWLLPASLPRMQINPQTTLSLLIGRCS